MFRFAIFVFCCLAVVNSVSLSEKSSNEGTETVVSDRKSVEEPVSERKSEVENPNLSARKIEGTDFNLPNKDLNFRGPNSEQATEFWQENKNPDFGMNNNFEFYGGSHKKDTDPSDYTSENMMNPQPGELHIFDSLFATDVPNSHLVRPVSSVQGSYDLETQSEKITNKNESATTNPEFSKNVCFPHVGCFSMDETWKSLLRPIGEPHGPKQINARILFYNRENANEPTVITLYPEINMNNADFDPKKSTAILIHGFASSGDATWLARMKNAYLKRRNANVMILDWGQGAQKRNYLQVASNTRVVGRQLAMFLKYLVENKEAQLKKFHLIGHSLGAQIAGYAGKETPGVGRLTGLDPAQPGFEGFDPEVRLDKTDAEFVDVIHTDARPFVPLLGFGMMAPAGHVDFYLNGGFEQPGCLSIKSMDISPITSLGDLAKYPVEVISRIISCPHGRAYEYFIESFDNMSQCIFWGHKADLANVLMAVSNSLTQGLLKKVTALSSSCSRDDCVPMGLATKKSPLRGVFMVTTNNKAPYCISEGGIPLQVSPTGPPENRKPEIIKKVINLSL